SWSNISLPSGERKAIDCCMTVAGLSKQILCSWSQSRSPNRFLSGHNTGQDARDSDPQKKVLGIAVHNDRPERRYSGLLASLRSDGGQTITATAPDGISKRTQPH